MPDCGCTIKVYCGDARLLRKREDEKFAESREENHEDKHWQAYLKAAALRREHRDKALKRGSHA